MSARDCLLFFQGALIIFKPLTISSPTSAIILWLERKKAADVVREEMKNLLVTASKIIKDKGCCDRFFINNRVTPSIKRTRQGNEGVT